MLFVQVLFKRLDTAIEANRENLNYKKEEIIFKEAEKVNGIYFIDKGSVKIHKQWGADKELIARFAKSGDIFKTLYIAISFTCLLFTSATATSSK